MSDIQDMDEISDNCTLTHEILQAATDIISSARQDGKLADGGTVVVPCIKLADTAFASLASELNVRVVSVVGKNTDEVILSCLERMRAEIMTVPAENNDELRMRASRLVLTLLRGAMLVDKFWE